MQKIVLEYYKFSPFQGEIKRGSSAVLRVLSGKKINSGAAKKRRNHGNERDDSYKAKSAKLSNVLRAHLLPTK